jgi:tetratricopeptide (TPR) repeat protein
VYPMNIAMIGGLVALIVLLWPREKTDPIETTKPSTIATNSSPTGAVKNQSTNSEIGKSQNVSKDPATGVRLNLKGHSLIQQGRYHEAVSLLYLAIKSFPEGSNKIEYFFAQYNLGHSLRKIGKTEEAIPYLERCVAYDNQNQMFLRELEAARRDLVRKNY